MKGYPKLPFSPQKAHVMRQTSNMSPWSPRPSPSCHQLSMNTHFIPSFQVWYLPGAANEAEKIPFRA
jgi:hypothetical protein